MNNRSLPRRSTWDILNRHHYILERRRYQQRRERQSIVAVGAVGFLVVLIGISFTSIGILRSRFPIGPSTGTFYVNGFLIPGGMLLVAGISLVLASVCVSSRRRRAENTRRNRRRLQAPSRPHHRYHQRHTTSSPSTGSDVNAPLMSGAAPGTSSAAVQPIAQEAVLPSAPPLSNTSTHPQHREDDLPPSYSELFSDA